jgi:hypothetical protein
MNDILIAIVGILVLTNFVYTIWSYLSLKKLTSDVKALKSQDRFILDNIVHSRSSLNVLYASIAIMAFVLGFFGFNIQRNVTMEVKREISDAARIDLDSLRLKAQSISLIESLAKKHADNIVKTREEIRAFSENIRRMPQKLYVIQHLAVTRDKHRFSFAELRPVDGSSLSQFKEPPAILWMAFDKENNQIGGIDVIATVQGIEAMAENYFLELWIYAK